jgi:hypothetical protein
MAYKTPELMLVGAAQNLVLLTSHPDLKNTIDCGGEDQVIPPENNFRPSW